MPDSFIGSNGNPAPPISDKSYQKPLHAAAEYAIVDVLEVLLRHGSEVAAGDFSGMQPLHYACILIVNIQRFMKNGVKTVKLLLKAGADVQVEAD